MISFSKLAASLAITCAVADSSVFDDVVAVQNTESLDLLLEVLHGGLLVGLQLLHGDHLPRVIAKWVITAKFNTAKVSLVKVYRLSVVSAVKREKAVPFKKCFS